MARYRFRPPEARSLRQVVLVAIRGAILEGKLPSGERLLEADIAREMGVSRGPVREALRQLEQEGLVTVHPYRDTVVAHTSTEEMQAVLLPIRLVLERFAVRKALPGITDAEIDALDRLVEEMKEGARRQDTATVVEQDLAFHRLLIDLSGSEQVVRLWLSIATRITAWFFRRAAERDLLAIAGEHDELIAALRTRDPGRVLPVLEPHILDIPG